MKPIRITSAKSLHDFVVAMEFSDGSKKEIDLEPYLNGPIFDPIRNDPEFFRSFSVGKESPTISWKNGADIDPYTLYYDLMPGWTTEDDEIVAMLERRRAKDHENAGKPVVRRSDITIR